MANKKANRKKQYARIGALITAGIMLMSVLLAIILK